MFCDENVFYLMFVYVLCSFLILYRRLFDY